MIATLDELRRQIAALNLTRLEDELVKLAKPCLHILPTPLDDPDALPMGAARLGGSPDVPDGFVWPTNKDKPLTFLAQFRLSEIAPHDTERILPPTGYLYFFYAVDADPLVPDVDPGWWKVVYVEDEDMKLVRHPHPTAEGEVMPIEALRGHTIALLPGLSLPLSEPAELNVKSNRNELEAYWKLLNQLGAHPDHQILGYPIEIQNEVEWDCITQSPWVNPEQPYVGYTVPGETGDEYRIRKMREWQLLFQIDTDGSLDVMWGADTGRLYVCIPKTSLRERRFEDCWTVMQDS